MKRKILYGLLLLPLLLSSCYSHKVIGLLQEPTKHNDLPVYDSTEYVPYTIRVNDEIIYRLITMDETISKTIMGNQSSYAGQYANSYRVYSDGTIDVPFLKPVHVEGLTIEQAQDCGCNALLVGFGSAQVVLAHYHIDLACEGAQIQRLFAGGVSSSDNSYRALAVEEAVAGGAGRNAEAAEAVLAFEAEVFGGLPRHDCPPSCRPFHRFRLTAPGFARIEGYAPGGELAAYDASAHHPGAETLGLGAHSIHKGACVNPFGKAGIILDNMGSGELSARFRAFDNHRIKGSPACVDGCGVAGRTGSYDEALRFFHCVQR